MNHPSTGVNPRHRSERFALIFWACLVVVWFPWFTQVSLEWEFNPQYGYGWAVPFMALFVLWMRWLGRPDPSPLGCHWRKWALPAVCFLILPLVAARIIGESNPDWRIVGWITGLCAACAGIVLVTAWGGKKWTAWFLFPLLFPLIATPWPTGIEASITQGLMRAVTFFTVEIAQWSGIPAIAQGNLILTGSGLLGVDEACSGVRSFQASLMAGLFLGELYMLSVRRRLGLFAIALGLAFVLNVIRAEWLLVLAHRNGLEAVERWHDPAGWTIFGVLFVVLFWVAYRAGKSDKSALTQPSEIVPLLPKAVWALPVIVVLVELGTWGWFRDPDLRTQSAMEWSPQFPQTAPSFEESEPEPDLRRLLRFDEGRSASWIGKEGELWQAFYFRWDGTKVPVLLSRAHAPEVCLPAAGLVHEGNLGWISPTKELPRFAHTLFRQGGAAVHVFHGLDEAMPLPEGWDADPWSWRSRLYLARKGWRHGGARLLSFAVSDIPRDADAAQIAEREIGAMFSTP